MELYICEKCGSYSKVFEDTVEVRCICGEVHKFYSSDGNKDNFGGVVGNTSHNCLWCKFIDEKTYKSCKEGYKFEDPKRYICDKWRYVA